MTELQDQLIRDFPLHAHLELELEECGNAVTVVLPNHGTTLNHLGTQAAASLFATADAATGVALISLLRPHLDAFAGLVSNVDVEFIRPAVGRIVAVGRVVADLDMLLYGLDAQGRAKTDVIATLDDPQGQIVCEVTATWHLRIPSERLPALWHREAEDPFEEPNS